MYSFHDSTNGRIIDGLLIVAPWSLIFLIAKGNAGAMFDEIAHARVGTNLNEVEAVYHFDIFAHLCVVDAVEKLGINRYFKKEIQIVLDDAYRYWLEGAEEIFLDARICAMAFRLLRAHGYVVSPDIFSQFTGEEFSDSLRRRHLDGIGVILELYRASQLMYQGELVLERQNSWACNLLRTELLKDSNYEDNLHKHIMQEVEDALKFPYHVDLERFANRRNIEYNNIDYTRVSNPIFCSSLGSRNFLKLAVEDFNMCQSLHREELECLKRWVVEKRLNELKFARQKHVYSYFSAAATMFAPELSAARMCWAKSCVLVIVTDDFFDIGGSPNELINVIQLMEKWDVNDNSKTCSEHVHILFSALHSTICEIGDIAFALQGRNVEHHVVDMWVNLLHSFLKEENWRRTKYVPLLEEYMENAYISFALGPIVLPTLYFLGPQLSEETEGGQELQDLFKMMSTCGRLLNDCQSFKREEKEGKLNAVSLHVIHGPDGTTKENAVAKIKSSVEDQTRLLLRSVLTKTTFPTPCKDPFWKMLKVLHFFYSKDDGFSSDELSSSAIALIYAPISLPNI